MGAHHVAQAHPVDRGHDPGAEILREPLCLVAPAGAVHDDRVRVVGACGVADACDPVAEPVHLAALLRGCARLAIPVQDEDRGLATREERRLVLRRPLLRDRLRPRARTPCARPPCAPGSRPRGRASAGRLRAGGGARPPRRRTPRASRCASAERPGSPAANAPSRCVQFACAAPSPASERHVSARPSSSEVSARKPSTSAARAGIEERALQLAGPRLRVDDLRLDARGAPAELRELEHRGLAARADVEDAALRAGRRERRARHVAHVDVVARLAPVAEDGERLAAGEAAEEDRHDAGLAVRVLPRPEDVAVAQRHVLRAVEAVVGRRGTPRRRASRCRTARAAGARRSSRAGRSHSP